MRSILALAAIAQLAAVAAMAQPIPDPHPQPKPEPDPMMDDIERKGALRMEAALLPKRSFERRSRITREDLARYQAEDEARRVARAAKRIAIRDAQLARGQRTA